MTTHTMPQPDAIDVMHAPLDEATAPGATASAPVDESLLLRRLDRCLTKEYRRSLYYFVLRRVGSPEDAEDLVQQALVEATRHIHRFRGEAEVSTWVYGIALNLARNHLSRSPGRRHIFESDDVLEEREAPNSDPCDLAVQRQTMVWLGESLGKLRDGSLQALMLVAVDGLSYEEAASELGVPVGTIRSRVSRARAEIRQRLNGAGL